MTFLIKEVLLGLLNSGEIRKTPNGMFRKTDKINAWANQVIENISSGNWKSEPLLMWKENGVLNPFYLEKRRMVFPEYSWDQSNT